MTDKTTHFGAQTIPEDEKAGKVRSLFTDVANKYDIMNDGIGSPRAPVKSCWMWRVAPVMYPSSSSSGPAMVMRPSAT